ncbi:MAG: ABC transporter substrate-binding protein, partial [Thermoplasmata archaeon]|nr:ABC transporter substrate-binding protein [Thermoplasmata archaeon]
TKVSDLDTVSTTTGTATLYLNPNSLVGIAYDVQLIGKLGGATSQADALDAAMSQALSHDESALANVTTVPRVLLTFYVDTTGYWTFGPGTFGEDLVTLAGATSITGDDPAANQGEISGSYVLAANPQVVLVGTGFGLNVSDYNVAPDWSSLTPVNSPGHLLGVDSTLLTEPDASMVFGVATLIGLLHPELSGGTPL